MSKKIISYYLMIMTFCLISQSVDANKDEDLDLHVDKSLTNSPLNPNDVLFSPDEDRIIAICDIRSSIPSRPLFPIMMGGSMFLPPNPSNIDSINSKVRHVNGKLYYGCLTEHELTALMEHDDSSSKDSSITIENRGAAILRSLEDFIFPQDTNSSPCDNSPLHSTFFPGITINELD